MGFFKSVLIDAVLFIAFAGLFAQTGMFYVSSVGVALLASLVLAVLNALVKPFLLLISLPINVLTLGLFSIVINGFMLILTSSVVGKSVFYFSSLGSAMLIALIMSVCNTIIANHFVES